MVHFADVPQSALPDIEGDFNGNMDHLSSWVQQEWPATKPVAPQYTPSPIVNDFEEAFDNLQRQNWNSAGMALRRTLEMTVNHVGKDQIGEDEWKPLRRKSLEKRIDALGQHGLLSPALLEWAHELRESLNKATHEEDPYTEQEAREMGDIAELMLTYLFTLPVRLKNRREQRELEKQQAASELDFDDEIPF